MTVSLLDLRTLARQEADMVNSQFVSDAELNTYINNSYQELYDLLIGSYEDYVTQSVTFTIASGQDHIDTSSLISGVIYKIRGVDKAISGPTAWATIRRFSFANRNKFNNNLNVLVRGMFGNLAYDWVGDQIRIIPADQAPGNYQLWYIPDVSPLLGDGYTILPNLERWAEYVVVDAAIKCLAKEETDVSVMLARKQALVRRIETMASSRDAGEPARISDVTRSGYRWGFDGEMY